eukprot:Rhum_TRINITY_DN14709_c19_g1::Rhum_TRINITY_DN14709_c19_g1_i1::g.110824::m.110824
MMVMMLTTAGRSARASLCQRIGKMKKCLRARQTGLLALDDLLDGLVDQPEAGGDGELVDELVPLAGLRREVLLDRLDAVLVRGHLLRHARLLLDDVPLQDVRLLRLELLFPRRAALDDALHLLVRQHALRARAPLELVELVDLLLAHLGALEGPRLEAVLHLVVGLRHEGRDETARGVPVDVRAHEVLRGVQQLKLVTVTDVPELEHSVERLAETREQAVLALRRPVDVVNLLVAVRSKQTHLSLRDGGHRVEGHRQLHVGRSVDEDEAVALRLEVEGNHLLGQLDGLDRTVLVADTEQLVRADDLVGLLLALHLARQEVALRVPRHVDVLHAVQVALRDRLELHALGAVRQQRHEHLDEGHTGRRVVLLRHPVAEVVVRGRPLDGLDALHVDGRGAVRVRLLHQAHLRVVQVVQQHVVLAELRQELLVVRPLERAPLTRRVRQVHPLHLLADLHVPHHQLRAPRDQELLLRREVDELHLNVRELAHERPLLATPKLQALRGEGDEVRAERRPLGEQVRPVLLLVLQLHRLHRLVGVGDLVVVPVDLHVVLVQRAGVADEELLAGSLVAEVLVQVLRAEVVHVDLVRDVVVRHVPELVPVLEHVRLHDVALVHLEVVEGAAHLLADGHGVERDEREAERHLVRVLRKLHEQGNARRLLLDLLGQVLRQLHELRRVDLRDVVHDHHRLARLVNVRLDP